MVGLGTTLAASPLRLPINFALVKGFPRSLLLGLRAGNDFGESGWRWGLDDSVRPQRDPPVRAAGHRVAWRGLPAGSPRRPDAEPVRASGGTARLAAGARCRRRAGWPGGGERSRGGRREDGGKSLSAARLRADSELRGE